jgi:tetrahydromethanopterin S-methyltransferase subunit B
MQNTDSFAAARSFIVGMFHGILVSTALVGAVALIVEVVIHAKV